MDLKGYVGVLAKERRVEVEFEGDMLKNLITALQERFPILAGYHEQGLKIVVNHRIISARQWGVTRLREDDEVALYIYVGGG